MQLSLNSAKSLEAAIDPNNRLTFLLDWELTMKCNLDCSYCGTGLYSGGHDNSQRHPPLADCLNTIDFMYEYADRHMARRRSGFQHVVLNVYGGESLHHPDIEAVLEQTKQRYLAYQHRWSLKVTTTTNAIVTRKKMANIIKFVDEFTVSYHSESTDRQKQLFRENVLMIAESGRSVKCVVLMHSDPELFADSQQQIQWCQQHGIRYLPKQLDHAPGITDFNYDQTQVIWFDKFYKQKSRSDASALSAVATDQHGLVDLADTGRACCGGRQLCENADYRDRKYFVANKFPNWFCSVDQFFLHIKQTTKEIFVNKDCKMNYQGQVGAIGSLDSPEPVLAAVGHTPTIQCKKHSCLCGLCAPKAHSLDTFNEIMKKYLP